MFGLTGAAGVLACTEEPQPIACEYHVACEAKAC